MHPLVRLVVPWLGLACAWSAEIIAPEPPTSALSLILGRPTNHSVAINVLSAEDLDLAIEYGNGELPWSRRSPTVSARAGVPLVVELDRLTPDTAYAWRLSSRRHAPNAFANGPTYRFQTCRRPGSTFTFTVQGDSHPERSGKMFNAALYTETMRLVARDRPDFHLTLGDDFSIERLIERHALTQANVDKVYAGQRNFLGLVGTSSALFLVNGNHEQAGRHWLDGSIDNPAVLAGRARNAFYALPVPDGFYTGDAEDVQPVGLLRDYYAWTWGDALFVTIDPYWHSPVEVDHDRNGQRGGKDGKNEEKTPKRDPWQATMGDAQYRWLHATLTGSTAKYKFVFAHHVLGTGRGGIEEAKLYEWGGLDKNGVNRFAEKRPGWPLPVHDLFVKTGVTVFFQGHDHIFAHQTLDGVVYQSVPNPADDTYQAFNRDRYRSGDLLENSGHVRVTVAPGGIRVDYVPSYLEKDRSPERQHGAVAFGYTVPFREP